jgi:hypothetical protein
VRIERRRRNLEWLVAGSVVHPLIVAFYIFPFIHTDNFYLVVNATSGCEGCCRASIVCQLI